MNKNHHILLAESIDKHIKPYAFDWLKKQIELPKVDFITAWIRKTWNTNRGVVLLSQSGHLTNLGEFAQSIKMPLGKNLGYKLFFYPLGLQLIIGGDSILDKASGLERFVDKIDNQRVILQSIYIVDFESKDYLFVRTWGQYISGYFQDSIEKGISSFLQSNV